MSTQRFQDKVALVTGGNSGIGLGVAKAYAREGAQVVITGRDEPSLRRAAQEISSNTLAIRSDAAKVADIENVVATVRDKHGRNRRHVHQCRRGKIRSAGADNGVSLR
jgi:NAD(P)-dependent dehydrogenase (short-subunit alcohol dehydrogenase family)